MFTLTNQRIAFRPMAPVAGTGALLLACAMVAYVAGGESAIGEAVGQGRAASPGSVAAASDALAADAGEASGSVAGEASGAGDASGAAASAALRGARSSNQLATASAEVPPTRRRCSGCGVVIATRRVAVDGASGADALSAALPPEFGRHWPVAAPLRHTFVVLLEDGSQRLIDDVNPLAWRIGERVMIIDASQAAGR